MERTKWVTPRLVKKAISDTAAGFGGNADGIGGEFVPGS